MIQGSLLTSKVYFFVHFLGLTAWCEVFSCLLQSLLRSSVLVNGVRCMCVVIWAWGCLLSGLEDIEKGKNKIMAGSCCTGFLHIEGKALQCFGWISATGLTKHARIRGQAHCWGHWSVSRTSAISRYRGRARAGQTRPTGQAAAWANTEPNRNPHLSTSLFVGIIIELCSNNPKSTSTTGT